MTKGRNFIRQPGGILTILLLALLLAFRVHACPMPVEADTTPSDIHNCCPSAAAHVDTPADPGRLPCSDGPCLQAFGEYGGLDVYLPSANEPDPPAPTLVVEWLPPDGSGRHDVPPPFTDAVGPPPLQRSRVLRL
jgi:hypothetical protein